MNKYDYDLIVIGGGAAGLTASTGAGQLGAKTLLIEKEKELGGDCLHYGCVPSKSLIKSAYAYNVLKNSSQYGLPKMDVPPVDFRKIRERIQGIVGVIQEHDSPEWIKKKYNVDTAFGLPKFVDEHSIILNGKKTTSKNFIIATGSAPVIPPIEGIGSVPFITNIEVFSLEALPSSMIILGGGPIGLEMAQAFARLGSKVTIIQSGAQLLPKEDKDVAEFVQSRLEQEGIEILLNTRAKKVSKKNGIVEVFGENEGEHKIVQGETLFVATGRQANVNGLDLKKAGIEYTKKGIKVDNRLRTSTKNIYACGDVNGGFQFTHVAGYEAGIAMVNVIMRLPAKADYAKVPRCTYLDPEVANIGYNEKRAKEASLSYVVEMDEFKRNDRALAEGEAGGFLKMLINKKGVPLGVQIVGYHAGDLIHEWVVSINGKVKLSTIAQSIHAYPTLSEINKTASGNYLAPKLFNDSVRRMLKVLFNLQG